MDDVDVSDLTFDEKVDVLMQELPVPIQEFLRSPERQEIARDLARSYNLHIDAAGAFEEAYIYLLLGVYTPDEFVGALREAGINEESIRGLAAEVNERVFKRLRTEQQTPATAPTPQAFRNQPTAPMMPPPRIEAAEPPPNLPGQNVRPEPPVPAAPEPAPAPTPIYSNVEPPPAPHARTMAEDMRTAQGSATPPVPETSPEPPVRPVYSQPPPPPPVPVPAPPPEATTQTPITKEYAADPYREPIE